MVGVPHSKACGTCRIRKKGGCDMKRPACGQCRKAGVKCEGYVRERTFVQVVYGNFHSRHTDSPNKSSPPQSRHEMLLPPQMLSMICSANEQNYAAIYWNSYLPEKKPLPMRLARYTTGGWTNALQYQIHQTPSMRRVLLALALSTAGREQGARWMQFQGFEYYVASLNDACSSLATQSNAVVAQCVTARLSALYELAHGKDPHNKLAQAQNFLRHTHGEYAIVTSQAPDFYRNGYLHQLFVDSRFHLGNTNALQCRKSNLLCSPEWKSRPWTEIAKTPFDRLMDIFVDTPRLLEDIDAMRHCSSVQLQENKRKAIIQQCQNLDNQLTEWRMSTGLPASFPHVSSPAEVERYFSVDLLIAVHIMCVYWSICIVVHSTWQIATSPVHGVPADAATPPDPHHHCRRIAEALPVLFFPAAGEYGVQNSMLPVAAAMTYLNAFDEVDAPSEEKIMMLRAFEDSPNAHLIDDFRDSMQRQDARTTEVAMREGWGAASARARSWFGID